MKTQAQKLDFNLVFPEPFVTHKEFSSFLDNSLEGVFSEKEKAHLTTIFDKNQNGLIEKRLVLLEIDAKGNKNLFQIVQEEQNCSVPQNLKDEATRLQVSE